MNVAQLALCVFSYLKIDLISCVKLISRNNSQIDETVFEAIIYFVVLLNSHLSWFKSDCRDKKKNSVKIYFLNHSHFLAEKTYAFINSWRVLTFFLCTSDDGNWKFLFNFHWISFRLKYQISNMLPWLKLDNKDWLVNYRRSKSFRHFAK